jgi:hypothetical protein
LPPNGSVRVSREMGRQNLGDKSGVTQSENLSEFCEFTRCSRRERNSLARSAIPTNQLSTRPVGIAHVEPRRSSMSEARTAGHHAASSLSPSPRANHPPIVHRAHRQPHDLACLNFCCIADQRLWRGSAQSESWRSGSTRREALSNDGAHHSVLMEIRQCAIKRKYRYP